MTAAPEAASGPLITVAAIAFLRADGRVLTVRKRGTSAFMLPGGKPENGESAVETAIREVHEELGIRVAATQLNLLGAFASRAANEAGHALLATVFTSRAAVAPVVQAEIDEARWVLPAAAIDDATEAPLNREHVFPLLAGR
ncbi:NUDIX domain-containing protein [Microbacterium oryzae]|uniref:NUDIX domain-containing protein n=1 Tax=Microbacterium oryzae TaxID=743009 RepID=A0A6I6E0L5_9MICO|nr:NUDIX domain-containing protein [Microbacterium oryzae]QGU28653.1 NUDIX domain-containing protein [Microbacterium oryzae]